MARFWAPKKAADVSGRAVLTYNIYLPYLSTPIMIGQYRGVGR